MTKQKNNKQLAEIQEKRIARALGGYTQAGSGCSKLLQKKGDVKTKFYKVECKFTSKKSFSLKKEYLDKISKEALSCGLDPVLEFEFMKTTPFSIDKWVAIPLTLFEELQRR